MKRLPLRFTALALAAAVAAGCASNDTRVVDAEPDVRPTAEPTATIAREDSTDVDRSAPPRGPASDQRVGVPACDDYLASYKACHAVIGAYAPDVMDRRYSELRRTLITQAGDPEVAGTLETRCNGLIAQRDEALAGRACLPPETTPVATTDDELLDDGD